VPSARGRAHSMAAWAVPVASNAASKATVFMVRPPGKPVRHVGRSRQAVSR
jgi:hypothetical protein